MFEEPGDFSMSAKSFPWLTARPIAHRGLHDVSKNVVENTATAFQLAIDKNYSIELDVQLTKDGQAAVFHDYDLDRLTTSSGKTIEKTMDEMRQLQFKHSSDPIQTLPEILALIDGKVPVVIELKAPQIQTTKLEEVVATCLQAYSGEAAVMSFSPDIVTNLTNLTDRPRGIVSCDYFHDEDGEHLSDEECYALTHLLHFPTSKPDFISYGVKDFPAPSVDLLKSLYAIPTICWTTTDETLHAKALRHCDQVTFEGYDPDSLN